MCKQCLKNPVYEFTNKRKLCKVCFIEYFQKKVFYTIRKFNLLNQEERIYYKKSSYFRDAVLREVLRIISAKFVLKLSNSNKRYNKIAISSTLDLESEKFVNNLIKRNLSTLDEIAPMEEHHKKIIIKPLYFFLDEEVLLYAKLKGLNFSEKKHKKNKIANFIDGLEKKHPEIKRAIINSYLGLN